VIVGDAFGESDFGGKQRFPLPGAILQRTISHRFDSIR
jgi:hypothetical protein